MRTHGLTAASLAIGAALLAACTPAKVSEPAPAASATPPAPQLPVSLNAVMVAMVDFSAEPIWMTSYKPPTSKEGWRDLEYHAYEVAVNGKLIQLAGTGPNDAKWVSNPDWTRFADAMSAAGMDALKGAQARDIAAVNLAGDRLVEACEGCHKVFKPDLTTQGLYKDPDYPKK
jgi:hypothetical protein